MWTYSGNAIKYINDKLEMSTYGPDKGLVIVSVRPARTRRRGAVCWAAGRGAPRPRRTARASPAPPSLAGDRPSPAISVVFPIPWKQIYSNYLQLLFYFYFSSNLIFNDFYIQ